MRHPSGRTAGSVQTGSTLHHAFAALQAVAYCHAAMRMPCVCHAYAMRMPSVCHAYAMRMPCVCHVYAVDGTPCSAAAAMQGEAGRVRSYPGSWQTSVARFNTQAWPTALGSGHQILGIGRMKLQHRSSRPTSASKTCKALQAVGTVGHDSAELPSSSEASTGATGRSRTGPD